MILANTDSQNPAEFNYYLISADENGDTVWTETIGTNGGEDRAFDLQNISQSEYIIAGSTFDAVNFGEATLTVINDDRAPVGVIESNQINGYSLADAYPNPFNPTATIKYSIGTNARGIRDNNLTSLKVYDILGNEVAVLVNTKQAPGEYEVKFNAAGLASGLYLYKLQSGNFVQTKKMVLLK